MIKSGLRSARQSGSVRCTRSSWQPNVLACARGGSNLLFQLPLEISYHRCGDWSSKQSSCHFWPIPQMPHSAELGSMRRAMRNLPRNSKFRVERPFHHETLLAHRPSPTPSEPPRSAGPRNRSMSTHPQALLLATSGNVSREAAANPTTLT